MRAIGRTAGLATTALGAVLLLGACGQDVDGPDPSTEVTPVAPADGGGGSVTSLEATPSDARCAVPSVELLRTQDTAFEGTVTEVGEGTATLDVERWYAGEETEQVRVSTPSREIVDLLLAVDFQEGGTYLVSATDGQVSLCGLSAEKDELISRLYDEAWPS